MHFLNQVDEADLLSLMDEDTANEYLSQAAETEDAEPEPEEPEPTVTPAAKEPEATAKTNTLPSLILLGAVAVGGIGFAVTLLKRKKAARQVRRTLMGIMRCTAGMSSRRKKWMKMMYNWQ